MSKITLNNISSFQNDSTAVASYTANNATLTTAFDNTLSRDGTSPNQMGANLDMNSFRILNLAAPTGATDPVRLQDLTTLALGSGNVLGPATNLDNTIVLWNGANSKTIKDSGILVSSIASTSTANTWTNTNVFSAAVTLNGTSAFNAAVTFNNPGTKFLASSAGIEIGSVSGVNTPFIDWHSSGANIDYDVRFLATGGDGTNIGTGTLTLAGTLNITPAPLLGATSQKALTITQLGTGSLGAVEGNFNTLVISSDNIAVTGLNFVNGYHLTHHFGGAATQGGRQSLAVSSFLDTATNGSSGNRNYVAAAFAMTAVSGDGGGVGTEKGAIFGINPNGIAQTGALNLLEVSAGECNVALQTGSSATYVNILSLVHRSDHAVQGSTYDTMLAFSGQTGAAKAKHSMIMVGSMNGQFPLAATSALLNVGGTGGTITTGFDFTGLTFTGNQFTGTGFTIDSAGIFNLTNATQSTSSVTGALKVSGGAVITKNLTMGGGVFVGTSSFQPGGRTGAQLYTDASHGLVFYGQTGSTYDFGFFNAVGDNLFTNPTTPNNRNIHLITNDADGKTAGFMGIGRNAVSSAIVKIAGPTTTYSQINLASGTSPTTPNAGDIWNDGTSTFFKSGLLATAALGYTTTAGGTVTQATSRTTGVTINTPCGAITLFTAAGSATPASFTVTNSSVAATDTVVVSQKSGTDLYEIFVTAVAAGSFRITSFTTGGTTSEAPVFNFAVIKAVTS